MKVNLFELSRSLEIAENELNSAEHNESQRYRFTPKPVFQTGGTFMD